MITYFIYHNEDEFALVYANVCRVIGSKDVESIEEYDESAYCIMQYDDLYKIYKAKLITDKTKIFVFVPVEDRYKFKRTATILRKKGIGVKNSMGYKSNQRKLLLSPKSVKRKRVWKKFWTDYQTLIQERESLKSRLN